MTTHTRIHNRVTICLQVQILEHRLEHRLRLDHLYGIISVIRLHQGFRVTCLPKQCPDLYISGTFLEQSTWVFWVYLVTEYHTSRSPPWCVSNERRHRSRKPEPSPSLRSSHTCAHDVKSGQARQTFWQSILTSDGLMEDNSPRDTRGPYDQGHTTNNVSLQHRTTPT